MLEYSHFYNHIDYIPGTITAGSKINLVPFVVGYVKGFCPHPVPVGNNRVVSGMNR
jgi:hypothetical protein